VEGEEEGGEGWRRGRRGKGGEAGRDGDWEACSEEAGGEIGRR